MELTADFYSSNSGTTKKTVYNALIYVLPDRYYKEEDLDEPIRLDSHSMEGLIELVIRAVYNIYEDNTE